MWTGGLSNPPERSGQSGLRARVSGRAGHAASGRGYPRLPAARACPSCMPSAVSYLAAVLAFYMSQFSFGSINSVAASLFPCFIGSPLLYPIMFFFAAELYILQRDYRFPVSNSSPETVGKRGSLFLLQAMELAALPEKSGGLFHLNVLLNVSPPVS